MKQLTKREFLATAGVAGAATAMSCAGFDLDFKFPENSELAVFTVETIAIPVGYYAAGNDNMDTAFRELYSLATTGKLTPEGINKVIMALGTDDPIAVIMVRRALRLAELAGATIDGGLITDIAGLDPRLVQAVADGYVEGFDTYKATQA